MSNDRLLTDEEFDILFVHWSEEPQSDVAKKLGNTLCQAIFKAQDAKTLKAVVEWGDSLCPHGTKVTGITCASKRECGFCWREFCNLSGRAL